MGETRAADRKMPFSKSISIQQAAERLRAGELVAFPTETVYGLGANALDANAVQKIYALKGRPATSPLIVHIASIEMARECVSSWPEQADRLARRFWPGPLTLVLPKNSTIPDIVTAGLATVGIRMPNHAIALELIARAGVPLAAPSANRFTSLSPTTAAHVHAAFGDAVPVIDGGPCGVGIESTVVSLVNGPPELLRPGMILFEDVLAALDNNAPDQDKSDLLGSHPPVPSKSAPEAHPSPGMHPRHYSPHTRLLLVHDASQLPSLKGAYLWRTDPAALAGIPMPQDPAGYAALLYSALHQLDEQGWPWIAVELPPNTAEWAPIHDRLKRAAAKDSD